jgi:hypothetical protein
MNMCTRLFIKKIISSNQPLYSKNIHSDFYINENFNVFSNPLHLEHYQVHVKIARLPDG